MHIKYYEDGAIVSFTHDEAKQTYEITGGGEGLIAFNSRVQVPTADAFDFLLSSLALISMLENLTPDSMFSQQLQRKQVCELIVQQTHRQQKYEYAIENTSGQIQYEIEFDFISFLTKIMEENASLLANEYQIDDGEYCDEFGNPLDTNNNMYPYLTSDVCNQLENMQNISQLQLYGGTKEICDLKNYIPEDIKNAKIYLYNAKYYIIGNSETEGLSMLPEFIIEHGKLYAGKKKTNTILSLLKD